MDHSSEGSSYKDEPFVWPCCGIIVNLPVKLENGRPEGDSMSWLKQELLEKGLKPMKVSPLWNRNGFSGRAIVNFEKGWPGFHDAISFERFFEADHFGKSDWIAKHDHGSQFYGWVARGDDYGDGGVLGKALRKFGDLKTVRDLEAEDERKIGTLVSCLSNVLDDKDKHLKEMKDKVEETSSALDTVMEEKEKLISVYNEKIRVMHVHTQNHLKKILHKHEERRMKLKSLREELQLRARELEMREAQNESDRRKLIEDKKTSSKKNHSLQMATMEQKRADEDVLKLVNTHKTEIEELNRRKLELEKEMERKHALQLEIVHLKGLLNVRNHLESGDLDTTNQLKVMTEELEEKEAELEYLTTTQTALLITERETNTELQDARKELIRAFEGRFCDAHIGLKRMGDLDIEPFKAACKRKYGAAKADEKAFKLCSLWDSYLRKPQWHPYKIVKLNGKDQEIVDGEDKKLKDLKRKFGNEVYDTVATALLELNEYNPSGRYPVKELWNFNARRRATLKEGVKIPMNEWRKQEGLKII